MSSFRRIGRALSHANSDLEQIVVLSQRTSIEVARAAQFEAPNLVNITTFEKMRKIADISVAEAHAASPAFHSLGRLLHILRSISLSAARNPRTVWNATRTFADLGATYAITQNLVAYFNAKNLLNTPHKFYQGTFERVIQRGFYGRTYQVGVRFDY